MAMLYPPYIEGTLPTQVGNVLSIPYLLNRAVGIDDLLGARVCAKITTAATGAPVCEPLTTPFIANKKNGYFMATFSLLRKDERVQTLLQVGAYYKIQLAFAAGDTTPTYYSTIGVFKYSAAPSIGLTQSVLSWTGTFDSRLDPTEDIESYCFNFYNFNDKLIGSSGWIFNTEKKSQHNFTFETEEKLYYGVYEIKTISGYSGVSDRTYAYPLIFPQFNLNAQGFVKNNTEDGFIYVGLRGKEKVLLKADCYLLRQEDDGEWHKLSAIRFNEYLENKDVIIFEDFTVTQGKVYKYALQQYDTGMLSDLFILGSAVAEFENNYLYDGERQLKIKFNPKVTSFKTTMQEAKLDTLGGKYPFFFRNGHMAYKEFPLSGMISLHTDENGRFWQWSNVPASRDSTPARDNAPSYGMNLTDDAFASEREFKLEVLDWLNNGKPKLFRSAAEGNYIVRLMNTSLSPEDRLGRMLHTFNSTAYEMADCTEESMASFGFISQAIDLSKEENIKEVYREAVTDKKTNMSAIWLRVEEGTEPQIGIKFTYADGSVCATKYYQPFEPLIDTSNPVVHVSIDQSNALDPKPAVISYKYVKEFTAKVETPNTIWDSTSAHSNIAEFVVDQIDNGVYAQEIVYIRVFGAPGAKFYINNTLDEKAVLQIDENNYLLSPTGSVLFATGEGILYFDGREYIIPASGYVELNNTTEKLSSLLLGEGCEKADVVYLKPIAK